MGWTQGNGIAGAVMACLVLVAVAMPSSAQLSAQIPPPPQAAPDTLVFAGSENYPPFQWLDDNGEPRGFLIDLQNAIARQQDLEAEHRLTD